LASPLTGDATTNRRISVWRASALGIFDIQVEGARFPFSAEVVRQWPAVRTVQVDLVHEFHEVAQHNEAETADHHA
jgi:hypothetical protein